MVTYDQGFARIQELADEFNSGQHKNINEASTRLRFINVLLFGCLDWDEYSQGAPEDRTEVGVIDYSLKLGGTIMCVVEAKKTSIGFRLPQDQGPRNRLVRTVESIASLDKDIEAALTQAAIYAFDIGAPFVAVTNGHQVIAFCTRTEVGVSWRKGKALVFDSLDLIRDHFLEFWDALSVEAIRTFKLDERLKEDIPSTVGPRRSATIPNFDRRIGRNEFQADLQVLGDLVFADRIFEDRELFHQHCYCSGGALPQYSEASRSYLEDRYPDFFASTAGTPTLEPARTKKGPTAALTSLTSVNKPILILGDVGVGKTTFIEHLFIVDWADKTNEIIVLRVDFAVKPSLSDDIPGFIVGEIELLLLEHYGIDINEDEFIRRVYQRELKRFRRSPEGALKDIDENAFVREEISYLRKIRSQFDDNIRAIFKHLVKSCNRMVILIFDNVDQRDLGLQDATFIQAQIAASTWNVYVMVALRPETFVKGKHNGGISGYHPLAFTVAPPRFDRFIEKRISTAKRMLHGELPIPSLSKGIRIHVESVGDYLEVLDYSFSNNDELNIFCEDISGGNMRQALDNIIAFMSCGHVDAQKILDRWREQSRYTIPLHEFVRGVMFADREYYSGESAAIMNVFDCETGDPRETFGVIAVLAILGTAMDDVAGRKEGVGYVAIEDVKRELVSVGYRYEQAERLLRRCLALEYRLAETNLKSGDVQEATHVRITQPGCYYFHKLVRTFVYTDAVSIDTPIFNKDAFEQIRDVNTFPERYERVGAFVSYLDSVCAKYPSLRKICNWERFAHDILADRERARASGERALQRSQKDRKGG